LRIIVKCFSEALHRRFDCWRGAFGPEAHNRPVMLCIRFPCSQIWSRFSGMVMQSIFPITDKSPQYRRPLLSIISGLWIWQSFPVQNTVVFKGRIPRRVNPSSSGGGKRRQAGLVRPAPAHRESPHAGAFPPSVTVQGKSPADCKSRRFW
jgi:hypothetical protein